MTHEEHENKLNMEAINQHSAFINSITGDIYRKFLNSMPVSPKPAPLHPDTVAYMEEHLLPIVRRKTELRKALRNIPLEEHNTNEQAIAIKAEMKVLSTTFKALCGPVAKDPNFNKYIKVPGLDLTNPLYAHLDYIN